MSTVRELHNQAMLLAQQSQIARIEGQDPTLAIKLAKDAFRYESEAALLVPNTREAEPTRSILYRSAASLAFQAELFTDAQRFVMQGLSGFPPPRERAELEILYERIRFSLYLETNRLTVGASFQIVLRGNGVDYGRVPFDEFQTRTNATIDLMNRTTERKARRVYRKGGSINVQLRPFVPLITPQPAGSFVMAVELAQPEYEQFQETFLFTLDEIVDDVLTNIKLVYQDEREQLRERIPEEAYYRNFIAGAKRIAPDGKIISHVGLSDKNIDVPVTKLQRDIPLIAPSENIPNVTQDTSQFISIKGILDVANGRGTSFIGLTAEDGKTYDIEIAEGLDDLVRTYFKQTVTISGFVDGKKIVARDIGQ